MVTASSLREACKLDLYVPLVLYLGAFLRKSLLQRLVYIDSQVGESEVEHIFRFNHVRI